MVTLGDALKLTVTRLSTPSIGSGVAGAIGKVRRGSHASRNLSDRCLQPDTGEEYDQTRAIGVIAIVAVIALSGCASLFNNKAPPVDFTSRPARCRGIRQRPLRRHDAGQGRVIDQKRAHRRISQARIRRQDVLHISVRRLWLGHSGHNWRRDSGHSGCRYWGLVHARHRSRPRPLPTDHAVIIWVGPRPRLARRVLIFVVGVPVI